MDAVDVLHAFTDRMRELGPRLGPILIQCGPDFAPSEIDAFAAEKVVLGDFTETAAVFARRQCCEKTGITHNTRRLPISADQILSLRDIHTGLTANGRVDLPNQRGGDMHNRHAAVIGGCRIPGGIGHNSPADSDNAVGTSEAPLRELSTQ